MRTLWKGAISFGLVHVPIKLYTATENKDIKFNHLHEECKTPVKYEKVCPTCQREVSHEEIVRGYEYEKGRYVILREEDFAKIPSDTTRSIDIIDFVNLTEIDPIYFEKTYYLSPGEGGQKAYELLKTAMLETNKIAIAKVRIRSKESIATLRVYENTLVMATMYYPDEIRPVDRLPELNYEVKIKENEKKMAVNLIGSLTDHFEPQKYTNEYRKALMDMIQAKVAGEEIEVVHRPEAGQVVDLMEALKASIDMAKEQKDKKKNKKEKTAPARKKKVAKTS